MGRTQALEPQTRFSFHEQAFVDTVAKVLGQGKILGIREDVASVMYFVLLCAAASRGDIEAVERMLSSHVSIDTGDYDGRTPLHLASAEGQIEMVVLLSQGADATVVDRWGARPVEDAIRHGHQAIVKLLEMASDELWLSRNHKQRTCWLSMRLQLLLLSYHFSEVQCSLHSSVSPSHLGTSIQSLEPLSKHRILFLRRFSYIYRPFDTPLDVKSLYCTRLRRGLDCDKFGSFYSVQIDNLGCGDFR